MYGVLPGQANSREHHNPVAYRVAREQHTIINPSITSQGAPMTRYYFYTADLYLYDDPNSPVGKRVGDYQGVYPIEDDTLTPDQIFIDLLEELKKTIPADIKDTGYYHVTQFNNVT